jgi:hypothetical protein
MIIKNADNKDHAIATLESLLVRADDKKQKLIADELRMMRAGIRGENESAYQLDFHFTKSKKTAVIHDLRLDIDGWVAQIDHVLIHQTHRFYVLETKNFSHGLKINDYGEFLRWNDWKKCYEGMPSPIEQNGRHVCVLRDALEGLGYKNPIIESFVLISPNARIDRPKGKDFAAVVKADQFLGALEKNLAEGTGSISGFLGAVSKFAFGDAPEVIAGKLARLHKPISIDYEGKFGMRGEPDPGKEPVVPSTTPRSVHRYPETHFHATPSGGAPVQAAATQTVEETDNSPHVCKSCGSDHLAVEYGKFGYYFKCKNCDENNSIKLGCGVAGHKERIRKDKRRFYRECSQCGTSSVFFVNKEG